MNEFFKIGSVETTYFFFFHFVGPALMKSKKKSHREYGVIELSGKGKHIVT